jgi:hypothetical protein
VSTHVSQSPARSAARWTSPSSSSGAAQTSVTEPAPPPFRPTEAAHAAGGCGSSFRKLGDGPWIGTVFTADGGELTVEELASGWKVTDETGKSWSGRQLEQLLKRVLG